MKYTQYLLSTGGSKPPLINFILNIMDKVPITEEVHWVYFIWIRKSEFGIRKPYDWRKEEGKYWLTVWLAMRKRHISKHWAPPNQSASEFRISISEFKRNRLIDGSTVPAAQFETLKQHVRVVCYNVRITLAEISVKTKLAIRCWIICINCIMCLII